MNVLAIGAHPDDIEFGCGGTLSRYALQGHEVHLLVLTDGGRGGDAAERRKEQEEAATVLGARLVSWGGYEDTQVPLERDIIQKIEGILEVVQPELILVHYGDDTHQDHRNVSAAVVTASRYARNVLFYEGPTTVGFNPSVFVEIDALLQRKLAALRAHSSQVVKTGVEGLGIIDLVRAAAQFRGIQGRVRSAEGFVPLRLFLNGA